MEKASGGEMVVCGLHGTQCRGREDKLDYRYLVCRRKKCTKSDPFTRMTQITADLAGSKTYYLGILYALRLGLHCIRKGMFEKT